MSVLDGLLKETNENRIRGKWKFLSKTAQNSLDLDVIIGGGKKATAAIQAYKNSLQEATSASVGFAASIGNIGKSLLMMGVEAGVTILATHLIGLGVKALDNWINAEEHAIERAEEFSGKWGEISEKQKEAQKFVTGDSANRLAELFQGINERTGENRTLAADEYSEYIQLANTIGKSMPSLVSYWDAEGNAVLNLTGNVERLKTTLLETYETMARGQNLAKIQEYKSKDGPFAGFQAELFSPKTGTFFRLEDLENLYSQISGQENFLRFFGEEDYEVNTINFWDLLEGLGINDIVVKAAKEATQGAKNDIGEYEEIFSTYMLEQFPSIVSSVYGALLTARSEVKSGESNYREYYQSLVTESYAAMKEAAKDGGDDYIALTEDSQALFSSMLGDYKSVYELGLFKDGAALQEDYNKVIGSLLLSEDQNGKIFRESLNNLVALQQQYDNADLSAEEYRVKLEALVETIKGLSDNEDFDQMLDTFLLDEGKLIVERTEGQIKSTSASIEALTESYTKYNETREKALSALNSMSEQGYFTPEQYADAKTGGYTDAIKRTQYGTEYVDYQTMRTIEQANAEEEIINLTEARTKKVEECREAYAEFNRLVAEGKKAEAEEQRDLINGYETEIEQINLMTSAIEASTSALNAFKRASQMGELGDNFRATKDAIDAVNEGLESGRVGTNKFRAAVELIGGEEMLKNVQNGTFSRAQLKDYVDKLGKFYDDDGQIDRLAVFDQFAKAGYGRYFGSGENRRFELNKGITMAQIQEALGGVSEEYATYFLDAINEFALDANEILGPQKYREGYFERQKDLTEVQSMAVTAGTVNLSTGNLEGTGNGEGNGGSSETKIPEELVNGLNQLAENIGKTEQVTAEQQQLLRDQLSSYKDNADLMADETYGALVGKLQNDIDQLKIIPPEVPKEEPTTKEPFEVSEKAIDLAVEKKLATAISEQSKALAPVVQDMNTSIQGILNETRKEMYSAAQSTAGEEYEALVSSILAQGAEKLQQVIDTANQKATEITGLSNEAFKMNPLELLKTVSETYVPQKETKETEEVKDQEVEIEADLNISDAEDTLDEFKEEASETQTVKIETDTTNATSDLKDLTNSTEETVVKPTEADTDKAIGSVETLNGAIEEEKTKGVDSSEIKSAQQEAKRLNSLLAQTILKQVMVQQVGAGVNVTGGGAGGNMNTTMAAKVDGGKSLAGGTTLVGEIAPEIIVDRKTGTWRLAEYPQLTHLNPGDIVFNGKQTEAILNGRETYFSKALVDGNVKGGKSFAGGTRPKAVNDSTGSLDTAKFAELAIKYAASSASKLIEEHVTGKSASQSAATTRSGSGGGGGSGGRGGGKDEEEELDWKDWIERVLEIAKKATEKAIEDVAEKVGYIAKNAQLDLALEKNTTEIEKNEAAYKRYMQQAELMQSRNRLSADVVEKIQNGTIDITEYDSEFIEKIEEYEEWYNKAMDCKDAIEELQKQELELKRQKLDSISEYYDNKIARLEAQLDKNSAKLDRKAAYGEEITAQDYVDAISATEEKIAKLQEERKAYADQFDALVQSGVLTPDSDAWFEYIEVLEDIDESVIETQTDLINLKDEIADIPLTNLQYALTRLEAIQSQVEAFRGFHDAQGTKNNADTLIDLIENGFEQIQNLEQQNEILRNQQSGLDVLSEKWQELQEQIENNEQSIWDIKSAQEEWNDAIIDLQIDKLQEEREELEKTNEALEKRKEMEDALEDLEKAKQRTKLIYREGKMCAPLCSDAH